MNSTSFVLRRDASFSTRDPDENQHQSDIFSWFSQKYLNHEILPSEIILDLIARAKEGDAEARNLVLVHNMRLIVSIIRIMCRRKYLWNKFNQMDLVQAGSDGLLHAIEKFKPERGASFATYARYWIRQHINIFMKNNGELIRVPVGVQQEMINLRKAISVLSQKYGRRLSRREILEVAEAEKVANPKFLLGTMSLKVVSLDEPLNDDSEATLGNVVPDDLQKLPGEMSDTGTIEAIFEIVKKLNIQERDKEIFFAYFGGHESMNKIGESFGMTHQRVQQICKTVVEKIRQMPSHMRMLSELR